MKSKGSNASLDEVLSTVTYHHHLTDIEEGNLTYTWEQPDVISFDELIISWNAMRPQYGDFNINIAVKINEMWSPWFLYSSWASESQKGGKVDPVRFPVQVKQDILQVVDGQKATGFRVRVDAKNGASLEEFYAIHACASSIVDMFPVKATTSHSSMDLQVPLISQMMLKHPRHRDMCSAASTASVVSYLLKKNRIDPVSFALQSCDEAFDIYGNWTLNTAHASAV
ncbi:MAG TPA: hypothetical protein VGP47_02770, partial [Parachlamydiaceae bacterium]|nr:hypothetical protein [Parachlamydiaceae bacterium]